MSNVISHKLRIIRIIQEYSQPKIGRKMKNVQPGPEKQHSYKKKSVARATLYMATSHKSKRKQKFTCQSEFKFVKCKTIEGGLL